MKSLGTALFAAALTAACSPMQPTSGAAAPMVLATAADAPRAAGKTEVLWLGQASTRITTPGGKVIMIDPWLVTNPKTPANFKDLAALGKVDLVRSEERRVGKECRL